MVKKNISNDHNKLKDEIITEKVNEIFRSRPDNNVTALEEIDLEYHEEDDAEASEETKAKPKNKNQRELIAYLEGEEDASEIVFATFIDFLISEEEEAETIKEKMEFYNFEGNTFINNH